MGGLAAMTEGGAAGTAGGAGLGALIGSVIPGFGTAAGAIIGGALGGTAGGIAGKGMYDSAKKMQQQNPLQQSVAPQAGSASTELLPGQKADLINTSPQGVLTQSKSAKQTLLGN